MIKKKVVIIGSSSNPHVLNRISRFAIDKRFDFFLFDTKFNSDTIIALPRINRRGVYFYNLLTKAKAFNLLFTVYRLRNLRPDILFIMYCSELSLLYSLFFRGKVVLSFWGSDILKRNDKKKSFLVRLLQRQALLRADRIYCVSKEIIQEVLTLAGSKLLKKTKLLMYGLDLKMYNSSNSITSDKIEPFIIYSPRWCLPMYNIETLIDAVLLLLKSGKKVRLIYRNVYNGHSEELKSYCDGIRTKIINSGYENHFQVIGFMQDFERISLIKSADVVVSVSHFDGTPVSILEAMACRIITVSGKIYATENFISHRVNGYLVNKDRPSEIANQIAEIIVKRNEQKKIIENARLFVEQNADISKEIEEYLRCFNEF